MPHEHVWREFWLVELPIVGQEGEATGKVYDIEPPVPWWHHGWECKICQTQGYAAA